MKETNITVLMVELGKNPIMTTIKNDLNSLQKAVSIGAPDQGLIEIIGIDDNVCILCNEEGKIIGLEPNRRFYNDKTTITLVTQYQGYLKNYRKPHHFV